MSHSQPLEATLQPVDAAFQREWSGLVEASASSTIFATPEWHSAVQAACGDLGSVRVVTMRDGGELVGVLPLRRTRKLGFGHLKLLNMAQGGYGIADYWGGAIAKERDAEVAATFAAWLRRRKDWSLLDLQQLPEGQFTDAMARELTEAGLPTVLKQQNLCSAIALPSTWDEYRGRLSSNAREWIERKPRKIQRDLGAEVDLVPGGELIPEFARLRALHSVRFGVRNTADQERRLHVLLGTWLQSAAERDWIRMFRLRAGERHLGSLLGFVFGRRFYCYTFAFDQDPELNRFSPSSSLLAASIRWSIDHGLDTYDLLRGNYRYKARLAGELTRNLRLVACRSRLAYRVLRRALRSLPDAYGRAVVDASGAELEAIA